jgi:hypothetical protein
MVLLEPAPRYPLRNRCHSASPKTTLNGQTEHCCKVLMDIQMAEAISGAREQSPTFIVYPKGSELPCS